DTHDSLYTHAAPCGRDSFPTRRSSDLQPAIETLLDELARTFAPHCGAIIFSGMGEDGVAACGRLRRQGVEVWTQSAASAACSTMPQAVRTAGYSSRDGSPDELAAALQQWLEQERAADA